MLEAPRLMAAAAAADVLRRKVADPSRPMTVADASAASGLPLRDAEAGLHWLTSEYRGHLRVTEDGDLVHVFPTGFTKPWETREAVWRILSAIGRGLFAAGRFVVRAWLLIAMIAYALLFLGIMLGLTVARGSSDRDDGVGTAVLAGVVRAIADAVFWMFHPFSPLYVGRSSYERSIAGTPDQIRDDARTDDVPFYEKVNRFVFGPHAPPSDPLAMRSRILAEIRAQKGRIGLADVMRVTGLARAEADPLMARLMLDHDGSVEVSEQGGIVYRFEGMRRTAEDAATSRRSAANAHHDNAWDKPLGVPPLTGNGAGANIAISLLNAFNLGGSVYALTHGLTLSNLAALLTTRTPDGRPIILPDDGVPLALGVVPLVFSIALFALPLARTLLGLRTAKRVALENARLAIMREVLTRAPKKEPVPDDVLRTAYRVATGAEPTSEEITARVVDLGGDVDVGPRGEVRYRFADLEAEAEALADERAAAPEAEAKLGRIVFASDR